MSKLSAFLVRLLAVAASTMSFAAVARADDLAEGAIDDLALTPFVAGLELVTAIEWLPDGRLVMAEKTGRVVVQMPDGKRVVAGHLDVDSKTEKGLLNVIRHPDFERTRQLVFYYSSARAPELDKHKIALIRLGDDGKLDLASEQVLVKGLRGPDDHEMGGGLAIDRTGHLLVGVGDTGCRAKKLPEPPYKPANYFATCLTNGNGKILRIGLDGSVPDDNPLVAESAATTCGAACGDDPFGLPPSAPRKDIWTWGLRNPWRIWVDPRTGNVWTADVGDIAHEEIDVIPPAGGRHYGWPFREGAAGHPVEDCTRVTPNRGACVEPAYFCRHDDVAGTADAGCKSINGGLIIDECTWPPSQRGRYFFADNANGRIWSLAPTEDRAGIVPGSRRDVGQVNGFVVDMDLGPDGALYLAVMRIPPEESKVVRIAPRVASSCAEPAAKVADVGRSGAALLPEAAPKVAPARPAQVHPHTHHARRRHAFVAVMAFVLLSAAAAFAMGGRKG